MKAVFLTQQHEIRYIKQKFTEELCAALNLTEIQAPILTDPTEGVQDTLSGFEKAVQVPVRALQRDFEVVHSLAKWKRATLAQYGFEPGEGIVTQMKALRPDEEHLSAVHSVFVDQWDWEQVIRPELRTQAQLHTTVRAIYAALLATLADYKTGFGSELALPEQITFLTSESLLQAYPELTPKEREHAAAEKFGAIFVESIGGELSDQSIHDVRAPDYDDWSLNGDIIVWNPILKQSLELSSMGIRVDRAALLKQLAHAGRVESESLPWHQKLLAGHLPQTIGGGIGQSRLCMWMMQKPHIGYVQHGVWCSKTKTQFADLL
ncbi:aspartate--ammonia ligase [Aliidiomarina indica]|uniref:aspartate--ammonia ligase n=1 Tax=Aliidiomarina indica TaxID=2749147 RepID=UPI00188F8FAA|nr:aspartate--ammonia ligase [Aliidiomarina indica]